MDNYAGMGYDTIEEVLAKNNLLTNPAFSDLTFAIEDIPCDDTCPLGLYFPDTATIVIPPTGGEATLLHELGHRHGHYHYGDLSERYAENFRKKYQKGRILLDIGTNFNRLARLGGLFEEGEKGAIELAFSRPMTPDEIYSVASQLYHYDTTPKISYGENDVAWMRIDFTTGVSWPVIIASVIGGAVVLTASSLGYALYKAAKDMPWIMPVSLFAFGAFIVLKAAAGEVRKYATTPG